MRNHITLALCALLHAFTHTFSTMLVPLYILMARDLGLKGVRAASAIVTVYGLVYCLGSYPAGALADRFNRKALLGIGAGLGFFAGPQFAGWRAETAHWHWDVIGGAIGDWQRPLVEAGLAGVFLGIIFLLVARETHSRKSVGKSSPLGSDLRWRVARIAAVLSCRDFAGVASLSLVSIYLQKAHGLDAKRTGFILGSVMLISVVVNPIAVYFSSGRRRLPVLSVILICGGLVLATVPLWPIRHVLTVLTAFMVFQLSSYAVSDAAMLERVPADMRGRVVGLFLSIDGTFSSISPFVMGWWTDHLGPRAAQPGAYIPIFATLAALLCISAIVAPLIAHLGRPQGTPINPITEITPTMVEPTL